MKNKKLFGAVVLFAGTIFVLSMVSCATGPRVRTPMSGIESVIAGGTLDLRISGKEVTVSVSSTEDGTGAVASGTTISEKGKLTVDPAETAQNLYVTAASAADDTNHTLQIRIVTVDGVVISPTTATVRAGEATNFTVRVIGMNNPNQNVTWSVGPNPDGTGSALLFTGVVLGVLTVNEEERGTLYVKATSVVDPTKSMIVPVTVTQPSPVGTWKGAVGGLALTYTFRSGGKGTFVLGETSREFTWSTNGNQLILNIGGTGDSVNTYSINGSLLKGYTLTITTDAGVSTYYTKQQQ